MASSPPEHISTPTLRSTIPRHHGHHLRASADLSAFHSPLAGRGNRPNSEIYLSQMTNAAKKNNTAESTSPLIVLPVLESLWLMRVRVF